MRLAHVLDKLKGEHGRDMGIENMRIVLDAMVEDVTREAKGEIVESAAAKRAICKHTAMSNLSWPLPLRQQVIQ